MSASPDNADRTGLRRRLRCAVLWPATRLGRTLLLFPAVSAAFTIVVVLHLSDVFDREMWTSEHTAGDVALGLLGVLIAAGYTLLAPLAMAVVVLLVERYGRQGLAVLLVGGAVYLLATVCLGLRILHSADYTSGLLLLLSPAILGGAAALIGAVAGVAHSVRSWPTNR